MLIFKIGKILKWETINVFQQAFTVLRTEPFTRILKDDRTFMKMLVEEAHHVALGMGVWIAYIHWRKGG